MRGLLVGVIVLGLVACTKERADEEPPVPAATKQTAAGEDTNERPARGETLAGLALDDSEAFVLKTLGPPTKTNNWSSAFSGGGELVGWVHRHLLYGDDLVVNMWKPRRSEGPKVVHGVIVSGNSILKTAGGIGLGASRADVISVYRDQLRKEGRDDKFKAPRFRVGKIPFEERRSLETESLSFFFDESGTTIRIALGDEN